MKASTFSSLAQTLDDATSELYSVFFVEEEGTLSSFGGCKTSSRRGLFSLLYTDRGSHYWYTEEAGGRVDKTRLMQVHRALQQLRITLIAAYSLEVRWRSERVFRTLAVFHGLGVWRATGQMVG